MGTWGGGPARRRPRRRCIFSVSDKNSLRIVSSILACVRMVMLQYAVQMFPPPHHPPTGGNVTSASEIRISGWSFGPMTQHGRAECRQNLRPPASPRIFFLFSESRMKAGKKKGGKTCRFMPGRSRPPPTMEMCHGRPGQNRAGNHAARISHTRPRENRSTSGVIQDQRTPRPRNSKIPAHSHYGNVPQIKGHPCFP